MNVFFLGKPTCGKGTQSKMLADKFNMDIISTGNLFRELSLKDDVLGVKIKEALGDGKILPSALPIYLIINELISRNKSDGFVFEGSPRKKAEAEEWVETFK